MARVREAAAGIEDPAFQDVTEPQARLRVEVLQQEVRSLSAAIQSEIGARLGIAPASIRRTETEAMIHRRGFLASLVAAGAAPRLGWAAVGNPSFLAAAREPDGSFALYGLDTHGASTFRVPLPARGHAGAGHPSRAEAVAFARRPGAFALVLDCAHGHVLHELTPPAGRQFNGHGVFSADGAALFTSEQRSDTSEGVIGVWDAASGYTRYDEFPSGGLGPHDLRLMPDGETLVVANGGIATDATDRRKLNIPTMRPNLTYLSLSGSVREQVELESDLRQNSIRHLAVRQDGLVGFAMQWEGELGAATPLLGLHRMGDRPRSGGSPLADEIAMQGYAGSVAFSGDGSEIAITSPRGGRLHRFSDHGAFRTALSRADVCGLAPMGRGYLASDGLGGLISVGASETDPVAQPLSKLVASEDGEPPLPASGVGRHWPSPWFQGVRRGVPLARRTAEAKAGTGARRARWRRSAAPPASTGSRRSR